MGTVLVFETDVMPLEGCERIDETWQIDVEHMEDFTNALAALKDAYPYFTFIVDRFDPDDTCWESLYGWDCLRITLNQYATDGDVVGQLKSTDESIPGPTPPTDPKYGIR